MNLNVSQSSTSLISDIRILILGTAIILIFMLIIFNILFPGDTEKLRSLFLEIIGIILAVIQSLAAFGVVLISAIFEIGNFIIVTLNLNISLFNTDQIRVDGWDNLAQIISSLNDIFGFVVNLGADPVEGSETICQQLGFGCGGGI